MSRHRSIRNLNLKDELDDDALSDGGDDMTPEQQGLPEATILASVRAEHMQAQINDGLEQVRLIIGDEHTSELSDNSIKDVLWESYFDVEKTVEWALDERERRKVAKERKELREEGQKESMSDRNSEDPIYQYYDPHFDDFQHGEDHLDYNDEDSQPRLPSIFRAQQQPGFDNQAYLAVPSSPRGGQRLSTISERTERTEPSTLWRPRQKYLAPDTPRSFASSTTTSYGKELDDSRSVDETIYANPNPNSGRTSPSGSTVHRLSVHERPPSHASNDISYVQNCPPTETKPISSVNDRASMTLSPDHHSKSIYPVSPPIMTVMANQSQSKLSKLATSRASSISTRSEGSRLSGTSVTGSIKTFPALRPSVQSERPLSSVVSSKGLPDIPAESEGSALSSTSSIVRRAIHAAIELETMDRGATPIPLKVGSSVASEEPDRSRTPTPRDMQKPIQSGLEISDSSQGRPLSKLAMLARQKQKADPTERSLPSLPSALSSPSSPSFRPLSKLAMLSQQKVDASRVPKLPKTTTEYLTPIANGSSVTTAITTSYQSLYSLTDPSRPVMVPKLDVVPLQSSPGTSTSEQKPSKLAMKSKRANEKGMPAEFPSEEEIVTPPISPIFQPSPTHAHKNREMDGKRSKKGHKHKKTAKASSNVPSDEQSKEKLPRAPRKSKHTLPPSQDATASSSFAFDGPSPDDIVLNARKRSAVGGKPLVSASSKVSAGTMKIPSSVAKEREKAQKLAQKSGTGTSTPVKGPKKTTSINIKLPSAKKASIDQQQMDISGLNLNEKPAHVEVVDEPPKITIAREKVLEEARRVLDAEGQGRKKGISLVVIGHVDAGKSTLMGRLLYELGRLDEKTRRANERGSDKIGKGSFSWAWGLDGTTEERERGITMDIALQTLETPHRQITILDAPGHKDFIPNMISGASQADCALLVVDSTAGEFESGFQRGGQTREHILLVRSLGVSQVVVAVNKLDQVGWSESRYEEICGELRPFLTQSGFQPSKTAFVPVSAVQGVNLVKIDDTVAGDLRKWYKGPTLVDLIDKLVPPVRDITAPLRIPISNVFKRQSSGAAVSGRLCGGVVQVGEKLRILPGDETAIVKSIEIEDESVPWAASGSNATLHLTAIDPIHLNIGSVLCPLTDLVPLATLFTARIIVFDIQVPIIAGASVELFHHSRDVPATAVKLLSTIDRASGKVLKANPRVLTRGGSAEVQIALRNMQVAGISQTARGVPLEPFATNKDMGRILIRRGGETIAAGVVLKVDG